MDVVVEVMGGEQPAVDYLRQALEAGKSVVTANKEVMAKHGPDLLALASKKGVHLLFEASVGGGIPILRPLMKDLRGNEIKAVRAIINGTTNYIITKMTYEGVDFPQALQEAQDLGYAEPDPTNDVEGFDAAYKLAILASLAFQTKVSDQNVYREGISRLTSNDFRYARELGYAVKLMAIAKREGADVEARVHPRPDSPGYAPGQGGRRVQRGGVGGRPGGQGAVPRAGRRLNAHHQRGAGGHSGSGVGSWRGRKRRLPPCLWTATPRFAPYRTWLPDTTFA